VDGVISFGITSYAQLRKLMVPCVQIVTAGGTVKKIVFVLISHPEMVPKLLGRRAIS
jgi:hypothetical protein